MTNAAWVEHAYPLKQVFIQLQGTQHSSRESVVQQLETVLAKLKAGERQGQEHDDDFGYYFEYRDDVPGPSFFDEDEPNDV